jgi:hypothetical protein
MAVSDRSSLELADSDNEVENRLIDRRGDATSSSGRRRRPLTHAQTAAFTGDFHIRVAALPKKGSPAIVAITVRPRREQERGTSARIP